MKKVFLLIAGCGILVAGSFAQTVSQKLQKAFQQFESDSQLRHAISSLYIIDGKTGELVFEKNEQVGLAPASTQKIITSVTAFELLGSGYGYKTFLYTDGQIKKDTLKGNFIIKCSGDPTFGSWRYAVTRMEIILAAISKMISEKSIKFIDGDFIIDDRAFDTQSIPSGWIWQDIGNYYGAGINGMSWNENQYDLYLESGKKVGDPVSIIKTVPELDVYSLVNEIKTGERGSGDNAYIYIAPYTVNGFLRGTIPFGERNFRISGSFPYPAGQLLKDIEKELSKSGIGISGKFITGLNFLVNRKELMYKNTPFNFFISPSLDSIIYWFNKKSINLYGEALVKTFAYEKTGFGSTDTGVAIVKKFWQEKGLDEEELNIYDGSGLSPLNRVTTHAQVQILKYAKTKDWFPSFYDALPEYNGMKMKSGTISDVKGFCGYHTAKDGKEYIFSFLVNNYSGRSSQLVSKMYKVLDVLK